ncbi:MAG: enoyl-ACP reductase [Chloroflexota bacterium]|nr:enoyl-ACP reductase [Chloroflexota bacterium]MDE2968515.1 enoyl-ACP reductase [Chloroflexota bacterium]
MYSIDLTGKNALVFGVANQRSIAWAIARALHEAGANVALAYQNERLKEPVQALAGELGDARLYQCDMSVDEEVARLFREVGDSLGALSIVVHSIAFANREDLGGEFSKTDREGFRLALDVSAFSLIPMVRHAAPLMTDGGAVIAMTFLAAEKVFPGYNVMGVAKAALENSVKQLAAEYGPAGIRVNAISAGPLDTLSSRVISGYRDMKRIHQERAPMARNITHEDVGGAALFLCSDLSSGVTGTVLHVDAGYSIMGI